MLDNINCAICKYSDVVTLETKTLLLFTNDFFFSFINYLVLTVNANVPKWSEAL